MRVLRSVLTFILGALAVLTGLPFVPLAVLATEAPVTMWDKVDSRLNGGPVGTGATPCAQMCFRAFKSWCMQHLRGINLQLIDMADLTVDINPLDGAIRVYAIYARKQPTATDTYFNIFDDAATDGTAADARLSLPLLESGREVFAFYPDGLPLVDGLVVGAYTALIGANGVTPTTTGDGPNGFLLVGL